VSARGEHLVEIARPHIGERYVLGSLVPKHDPNWRGPWDCAELVVWAVYRVTGRLVGCSRNDAHPAKADAWTGHLGRDAQSGVLQAIPVADAIRTPGAILLRLPVSGAVGHVALSDGLGGTVEAMSASMGVRAGRATGRRWDVGLLVPGVEYSPHPPVALEPLPALLRLGDRGDGVRRLQQALVARGAALQVDGHFGQATLAAVVAAQTAAGLVVDGDVGPATRRALGLP
jgi:hypothetical protein